MHSCCSDIKLPDPRPGSHTCPANGKSYPGVKLKTLLHHLSQPWKRKLTQQCYYFCSDPNCDVVYFAEDNSVFYKDQLRTDVWQKSNHDDANICYCFGITKAMARSDTNLYSYVNEKTKNSLCSCETSNPSGRCCLKDLSQI